MNNLDFTLDENIKKCLIDFHNGDYPAYYPSLMKDYILTYHNLIYRIIKELDNYFASNELYCLIDIFNSTNYSSSIVSAYNFLIGNTTDALEYEPFIIKKWEVDKNVLTKKIKQLSEFQAFGIILVMYKFWREPDRYKNNLSLLFEDTAEIA
ncbi:MAG: hypothetical protein GX273_10665 [Bacteroidales bacterium]|nr:hypothetical protein [Bacteroidales bacterium]